MDAGYTYLNGLLDDRYITDLRRGYRHYQDDLLEEQSAAASVEAQERYESGVIEEARAMVAGDFEKAPAVEHLRILLERLDSATPTQEEEDGAAPF